MRLAIVVGGWHYPYHLFRTLPESFPDAGLFCIAHRSPDCEAAQLEKVNILRDLNGLLGDLDRQLYRTIPGVQTIKDMGWNYKEYPNTAGDWVFLNQWMEARDLSQLDLILWMHDDTYIRDGAGLAALLPTLDPECPVWTNGTYPQAPVNYMRGSFEIFRADFLQSMSGRIPVGDLTLTREGRTDSPAGMETLSPWNSITEPLRRYMCEKKLVVGYLSTFYRVSKFAIEGERGLLSNTEGANWSYIAGLRNYGVIR